MVSSVIHLAGVGVVYDDLAVSSHKMWQYVAFQICWVNFGNQFTLFIFQQVIRPPLLWLYLSVTRSRERPGLESALAMWNIDVSPSAGMSVTVSEYTICFFSEGNNAVTVFGVRLRSLWTLNINYVLLVSSWSVCPFFFVDYVNTQLPKRNSKLISLLVIFHLQMTSYPSYSHYAWYSPRLTLLTLRMGVTKIPQRHSLANPFEGTRHYRY